MILVLFDKRNNINYIIIIRNNYFILLKMMHSTIVFETGKSPPESATEFILELPK